MESFSLLLSDNKQIASVNTLLIIPYFHSIYKYKISHAGKNMTFYDIFVTKLSYFI